MKKKPTGDESRSSGDLRRRAEERLAARAGPSRATSPGDFERVRHDLEVHQAELQILNEELRRSQQELEVSRKRYFDLYDQAPIGYVTLSAEGLIQEANLTTATLLGVDRETLVKQPLTRFILKEDQDVCSLHCKTLFETGAPQVCEFRMVRAGAEPFWVRVQATAARDADGSSVCRAVMSDITERKQVEDALRESQTRYEAIFESTGTATLLVEEDTTIVMANTECLATTGYSPEELRGTKWPRYVAPDSLEQMMKYHAMRRRESGKAPRKYEVRLINKKGDVRHAILDIAMVPGTKRSVVSVLDVTEGKRAEEALQAGEAQLSNALKMARAGHWEYDIGSDIFTFNDNFYRIFRTTAEKVGGYKMSSADYARRFCHPDDAPMVGRETEAAIRSTDPNLSRQIEHRILFADGKIGYMAVRFFIVKDSKGRTVKTYGVNQDITERKQVEEKLRQQMAELRRWHDVTLGREERVAELKSEVHELLERAGERKKYGTDLIHR